MRWKTIKEFPNYAVSDTGIVMRIVGGWGTWAGRISKGTPDTRGYCVVSLCENGKRYSKAMHLLVLSAFTKQNPEGLQCNHKDGNKSNNNFDNLEWVTGSENMQHAYRFGLQPKAKKGANSSCAKLSFKQVRKIKELMASRISQKKIAILYNISQQLVSRINVGLAYTETGIC